MFYRRSTFSNTYSLFSFSLLFFKSLNGAQFAPLADSNKGKSTVSEENPLFVQGKLISKHCNSGWQGEWWVLGRTQRDSFVYLLSFCVNSLYHPGGSALGWSLYGEPPNLERTPGLLSKSKILNRKKIAFASAKTAAAGWESEWRPAD